MFASIGTAYAQDIVEFVPPPPGLGGAVVFLLACGGNALGLHFSLLHSGALGGPWVGIGSIIAPVGLTVVPSGAGRGSLGGRAMRRWAVLRVGDNSRGKESQKNCGRLSASSRPAARAAESPCGEKWGVLRHLTSAASSSPGRAVVPFGGGHFRKAVLGASRIAISSYGRWSEDRRRRVLVRRP